VPGLVALLNAAPGLEVVGEAADGARAVELTARETGVLRLVGNGLSNAQIAERFVLGEATVKTHVKRMMAKLRLSSRAQAVVVAYESGLVVPTAPARRASLAAERVRRGAYAKLWVRSAR
jgi:DNA-binding NarL/FixJ family response regulator